MRAFTYERPDNVAAAMQAGSEPGASFIAGGTNLLDLMKIDVEQPTHLVDISRLPLREVAETPDGGLRIKETRGSGRRRYRRGPGSGRREQAGDGRVDWPGH